jgi:hypothetical protein
MGNEINRRIDMKGRGPRPNAKRVRCPHPDCNHIGEVITKVHCRTCHDMERDDLVAKYGYPIPVELDGRALSKNSGIRTIIPNNKPVVSGQKKGTYRR